MAHELSIINGIAEMAYLAREGACWHGLGQPIDDEQPRQVWFDACNISNWDLLKCKSTFMDPNGVIRRVPGQVQIVRDDNFAHIGTVSEAFNIHSIKEVSNFMFDCVERLGFEMSTMGVLFNGKKFWCQANIKKSVNIGDVDRVDGKLLIAVPNTGKENSTFTWTTVRTVCNNTLRAALGAGVSMHKLNHLQAFNADEVAEALGFFDLDEWSKGAEDMSKIKLTDSQALDYLAKVFSVYEDAEVDEVDAVEAQEERLALAADNRTVMSCFDLFNGEGLGAELVTAKGTLWGAVNSVTQYVDHERNCRTWDARFNDAQFGRWANVKDRAWDEAIKMAA